MTDLTFVWDERKSRQNEKKHGVSFEEAQSVFFDENATQFFDESHSGREERFLMLGLSSRPRILLVAHTFRRAGSVIRIISARRATRKERRMYSRKKP